MEGVNAIILAAGRCTRFNGEPKGLQRVNGEMLIQRLIRQLHEVGIKDISIVLGHKKSQYLDALADEISDGVLKYYVNKKYKQTDSLCSLLCAVRELKGKTLILCQDTYFHHNILRYMPTSCSWYTMTYDNGKTHPGPWHADIAPDDRLTWSSKESYLCGMYQLGTTGFINESLALVYRLAALHPEEHMTKKVEDLMEGQVYPFLIPYGAEWNMNSKDDIDLYCSWLDHKSDEPDPYPWR